MCPPPQLSCPLRYKYEWRLEEARRNLLRTHTTSASARVLYQLARQVGQFWGGTGELGGGVLPDPTPPLPPPRRSSPQ